MRILIEQSGYPLTNMGDLAMLQVAIERFRKLWPDAFIQVFTYAPDKLREFCQGTYPLVLSGQDIWFYPISQRLYQLTPKFLVQNLLDFEEKLRYHLPSLVQFLICWKLRDRPEATRDFNTFMEAVSGADLVVASGGGYITDTFEKKANRALGILGLANRLGKTTVMLGQGLGPIQNPTLRTKAKALLPSIKLIALREKRAGIPLLNSFGISHKRFAVTGDDAIELAYRSRSKELGNGIGINLRIAKYSDVSLQSFELVRMTLQKVASKKGVPLIPVPIEFLQSNSDVQTIKKILAGYDESSDGGQNLNLPSKVIEQVGRCRVVVTGSYHAGVFALAQGIPVVSLAKSKYYVDKFLGLADQFGTGCEVIFLDDKRLQAKLMSAIEHAWDISESVRPKLLEAAKNQVALGHAAYQRVYELVKFHSMQ